MAESMAIYFSKATWQDVRQVLEEIAGPGRVIGTSGLVDWTYPRVGDNLVSLYEYNSLFNEFENEDLDRVFSAFGGRLPASVLCIEFRRSKTDAAINCGQELTVLFLKRFSGVADELCGSSLWTLEEITQGAEKNGREFLDCYRQKFLWRDRNPSS